jgi:hypothetical protein
MLIYMNGGSTPKKNEVENFYGRTSHLVNVHLPRSRGICTPPRVHRSSSFAVKVKSSIKKLVPPA